MASKGTREWASGQMKNEVYEAIYGQVSIAPNQIRLLRVLPVDAEIGSDLICELRVVTLQDDPEYAALSYTWGTQPFSHTVKCGGHEIPVTGSCFDALVAFRNTGWQMIWIDQLCIDQSNIEERSKQVQLMNKTYSQAQKVFVWLGPFAQGRERPVDTRTVAMSAIKLIQLLAHYSQRPLIDLAAPSRGNEVSYRMADVVWDSLFDLLNRPYFQRRWIIQEIVLNKNVEVLFGDQRFDWGILPACVKLLQLMVVVPANRRVIIPIPDGLLEGLLKDSPDQLMCIMNIEMIRHWRRVLAATNQDKGLLVFPLALDAAWAYKVTDPRDIIYALRGLIPENESVPTPDYSLTREQVLAQHARYLIETGHGSYVIESAGRAYSDSEDLPSWCPDWGKGATGRQLMSRTNWKHSIDLVDVETRFEAQIRAAGNTEATVSLDPDHRKVHFSGILVDTVVAMAPPDQDGETATSRYAEYVEFVSTYSENNFMSEKVFDIVTRFNNSKTPFEWADWSKTVVNVHQRFDFYLRTLYVPSVLELETPLPAWHPLAAQVDEDLRLRRLCATKQGYIGVLPERVEVGDKIVIGYGINAPMVLRKWDDSGCYELLGDSYVLGLAQGEALKLDCSKHPQDFTLI